MRRTQIVFSVFAATLALFGLHSSSAFAADDVLGCLNGADDGSLNLVFCSMANQFRATPKLISMFSWVGAVILGVIAFLNLKEYGDDPSKIPLRNIVIKFALAIMLVSLPFVMRTFVSTVTGDASMTQATMGKTRLGRGKIGGCASVVNGTCK